MNSRASLVLGLAMMGVSAWAVASAMDWPWKAALFPLVIGIPVFCLATAEVLWGVIGAATGKPDRDVEPSEDFPESISPRGTLVAIGWILGFFAAIALLGFPIAVPLFVFLYVKIQGNERWGLTLIFTVCAWAAFHALFDLLLHLPFPAGLIQTWAGLT